ncbi:MAG TPA: ferric reductase-like transmembrane domain-containing protein [Vicinamibacterales bacterium]|nr:ferric reductase-like transmembrane domain-containing protein [Vicinamibacterales bacterium]
MPSAVELSAYVALVGVGLLAANLLLGLLIAAGYNPARHWPHRAVKLFRLHNWTGYIALATAIVHPAILLFSSSPRFRVIDLSLPIWSPVQPISNVLGAIALYLVIVVVVTSFFRRALGRRVWKSIHYSTYAAAVVFFIHGLIADPTVTGRAIDYIDGEKVYVELCVASFMVLAIWRIRHRRARRRAELSHV